MNVDSSPPGDLLRATPSRLGVGRGHRHLRGLLAPSGRRSSWPSTGPRSSSTSRPRRDGTSRRRTRWASAPRRRGGRSCATYAQLTTSFVVFVNRVGIDESVTFWGGSEVIAPTGEHGPQRPDLRRGPVHRRHRPRRHPPRADRAAAAARRAAGAPGSRARPGHRRASRPGDRRDAEPGAGDDLDMASGVRCPAHRRRRRRRARARRTSRADGPRGGRAVVSGPAVLIPTGADGAPLFELPEELAIDTDVARRVIGEFIRGAARARPASSARSSGSRAASIPALVACLVAEAIGAEKLHCVLMPYRTSSPASRADAETVVAALGCSSEVVAISPMVDGYFGTPAHPRRPRRRQRWRRRERRCGEAISWPGCAWPCSTTDRSPGAGSWSGPATRRSR